MQLWNNGISEGREMNDLEEARNQFIAIKELGSLPNYGKRIYNVARIGESLCDEVEKLRKDFITEATIANKQMHELEGLREIAKLAQNMINPHFEPRKSMVGSMVGLIVNGDDIKRIEQALKELEKP
jgi:hypothetical protein